MKKFLTLAAAAILAGSSAHAEIVFGNLGNNGSGVVETTDGGTSSATTWYAQGFSTGVNSTLLNVQAITLGLYNSTQIASPANVSIWTDVGGQPGSSLYTSASLNIAGLGTKYDFVFSSSTLSAGTSYWVVFSTPGISWNYASTYLGPVGLNGSGYSYLGTLRTQNSGSSWGIIGAPPGLDDYAISVQATEIPPIPEPGTWAAAALLVGGAAFMRWRRRRKS